MRTDIEQKKDLILQWVEEGRSKASMSRELDCKPETLNRYLNKWDVEYKGNPSGKGMKKNRSKWTLEEYLEKSTDIQTNKIRTKLLEEGYKEHRCECCGLTVWMDKPIPLEVHHKDGNRHNNTIENFALLCPNCHAFTDSYRGKNSRIS